MTADPTVVRAARPRPRADASPIVGAAGRRRSAHRRRSAGVDGLQVACWSSVAVAVALWLSSGGASAVTDGGGAFTAAGIAAGLVATDLVLVMIVLAARIPLIDRLVGHDHALAVHRSLGKPVLILLLTHGLLLTIGYGIADGVDPIRETFALLTGSDDLVLAYLSMLLFVLVVVSSLVVVRRRLSYEAWHGVHLLTYAAVLAALPHQLSVGSVFAVGTPQRVYWIALYALAIGSIGVFRFIRPTVVSLRHRIRVVDVVEIAPGVVSIHLSGRRLDRLGVRGGQFGIWRFWSGSTWWHAHPVSFSAVPSSSGARITVRQLGAGSGRLARLRPGTRVSVEGPYGVFTDNARTMPYLAAIASGIGVTPVRALLEATPLRPGEATVLLRGSDPSQSFLWTEVAEIGRRTGNAVYSMVGHRPAPGGDWRSAEAVVRGITLRSVFPRLDESDVYVCGPREWTDLVVRDAEALGVPAHRLHVERFDS
ncbi:ferredoxin reductase family protein [Frigoribacterium sp. 2-23]|uniref:ferredoxin reductase family protein n=1 Tax=Frigoribacterium sp. 2-23 TaxID=3415006 RepID=UPI003C70408B